MNNEGTKATDQDSDLFGTLFDTAWSRIWSSKALNYWETFFWILLAIYLGLLTVGMRYLVMVSIPLVVIYWGTVFSGFILIGVWIYRAHFSSGASDELLLATPVPAVTIIGARFRAIFLSALRLYLPLILLLIAMGNVLLGDRYPNIAERWDHIGAAQLFFMLNGDSDFNFVLPDPAENTLFLMAFLMVVQIFGLGTLLVSWGLWCANRFHNNSNSFFAGYFSSILLPIALMWFTGVSKDPTNGIGPDIHNLNGNDFFLLSHSYWILAIIFFNIACAIWRRRHG